MFKRASKQVCLYTDRPRDFLDNKALRELETACNRGIELDIVVCFYKDPADCEYSKQDDYVWKSLKRMATSYKIVSPDMQECHAELIIADRISHFSISRMVGWIVSTIPEHNLSNTDFFNRIIRQPQLITTLKPKIKTDERCNTIGS